MKKTITLLLFTLIFGCSKEKVTDKTNLSNEQASIVSIGNDKQFISYLKDSEEFLNHKFDITQIRQFMRKTELNNSDKENFALALGFESANDFMEYAKMQAIRLDYLNNKYHLNSQGDKLIKDIILSGIYKEKPKLSVKTSLVRKGHVLYMSNQNASVNFSNDDLDTSGNINSSGDCKRRSYNCLAIATSAAVASQIACLAVDFATLGISAFFCHAAVVLAQIAMSDNCYLDLQACIRNQRNYASIDSIQNDTTMLMINDGPLIR